MASIFPAYARVHPSHSEPGLIMQYSQRSGAAALLAGGKPRVQVGTEDQYVYATGLRLRTNQQTSQSVGNNLPTASLSPFQINTPLYFVRVRTEYDYHDQANAGHWNVPLTPALRLAAHQAIFQQARNLLLYGRLPSNGEGLLNTPGATITALPADTNGNQSISTYDNGQMAVFLINLISGILIRMFMLGTPSSVRVCAPQQVLQYWQRSGIVQLTQFQRTGAGTATVAGLIEDILKRNGDTIEWVVDDTLIGKGTGGTNAIVFVVPEVVSQKPNLIDTGAFNDLNPGLDAITLMYADMAAPREITMPLAGGAVDTVFEQKYSSGWGIRGEGIVVLSAAQ
jgi:hypothetical protein